MSDLTPRFIGRRVERVEDRRMLLGQASYIADLKLPGMLHATFARSPHAHAHIQHVDTVRAAAAPEVFGVYDATAVNPLLAADMTVLPPHGHKATTALPLAHGKARFVGDPVAVVLSADRYSGEDAVELIDVDYAPLAAVIDVEQALLPGAPVVDESLSGNLVGQFSGTVGDVDGAFAAADRIVTATFRQHRQTHAPMETGGAVVAWNSATGTLDFYSSTQCPHTFRDLMAPLLGLAATHVRVITPDVGGGFGQKSVLPREAVTIVLLSRLTGRPIKWIPDRRESLMALAHAREEVCHVQAAVTNDGILMGLKADLRTAAGAYPSLPFGAFVTNLLGVSAIPGPWKVKNFEFTGRTVVTNKCPHSPYRAPGMISNVVGEGIMEIIAHELGIDAMAVRRRNIIRAEDQPFESAAGYPVSSVSVDETLEKALDMVGYADFREEQRQARERGCYLGLGVGTFIELGAPGSDALAMLNVKGLVGWDSATVRVEPTGQVRLSVGLAPHGQGLETSLAQVVADELGVPLHDVVVRYGDTERDPYGSGTQASRSAVIGGGATARACRAVRDKVFRLAGHLLDAEPPDLELRGGGRIGVRGLPDQEVSLAGIATMAYRGSLPKGEDPALESTARYEAPPLCLSNATHACRVEVDVDTGKVRIQKYVVVEDCGQMLNPMIVEGQVLGAIAQGIGGVLYEHAAYAGDGGFQAATFDDYLLPTAVEVPHIEIAHLVTPAPDAEYGVKPVGEGGVMGSVPAVLNAIADALAPFNVRVTDQPFSPSRLRDLLRKVDLS